MSIILLTIHGMLRQHVEVPFGLASISDSSILKRQISFGCLKGIYHAATTLTHAQ